MPQALAPGLAIATAIGLTGTALTVGTIAINFAIAYGLSQGISAVFGPAKPKPSDGQQTVREAVGSRKRHYGIVHTGGQLTFFESRNGTLGQVVTLGTGQVAEILEHRIHDKAVNVDGAGTVTDPSFAAAVHIHTRPGTVDQTAIGQLTAKFSEWTSAHRQRGCSHAAIIADPVKQKEFSKVYSGGPPEYSQVRKEGLVYDPRKDGTRIVGWDEAGDPVYGSGAHRVADPATWEWSDLAALVLGDFMAHADGFGLGYDNVNWTNIAQEADHCAATEATVGGETIARWRLWVRYSLAEDERREVLARMQAACDAFVWQDADGLFNLMVGRYEEPDLTITDDHILSLSAARGPESGVRISAIKALYTEAAIGYREQESALVSDPTATEDPNTDVEPLRAYYAPHHNQAVRLAKLKLAEKGDRWRVSAVLDLVGLDLIGRRFVRLNLAGLGINAVFLITAGPKFDLAAMRISASFREVRASDWTLDAEIEEGEPPSDPGDTYTPPVIPVPTSLALTAVQIALGETSGVAIEATWSIARAGLEFEVRYRPVAGGNWTMMTVDSDSRIARSGPVNSGSEYEVQARALTITSWASEWTDAETITPVATALLSAPSALAAEGGAGEAEIVFRMPPQPSLAFVRVYSNDSPDFNTAAQGGTDIVGALSETIAVTATGLPAGTQYFWARAFNGSGGSSALAGPVSATIS